ncbi:cytochrome c-type biogenesis protein CcmE homolog, mitochondrial [Arachis stenosperma]|uniref:cytochrome c-type biogenesis protein CcmE homolog, mitochondrial n=1 Tax=Arachis stenosperma TaxID=217475 RepID=UPI0025AD03B8|nr:cytochrome c-type biogenesis protein CcmE homolog, mitochondrial [Arachis stenosperma]
MATGLALRFRSRLLHTTSLLHSSLLHTRHPTAANLSPSLAAASFIRSIDSPSALPFAFSIHRRLLSTAARRSASRPKKTVDIGARARQMQTRRLWTYALTFGCMAGFIVIVLNNFQDQLVFYVTPSEALEKYAQNPTKTKFRLGGLVLEGSVVQPASSAEMEFVVSDLITDILVRYQGSLPDLFREGHSVVVEGFVKPFTDEIRKQVSAKSVSGKARSGDCYFSATEVLAKHDEKYMPKEVAAAIEKNKKIIEEAAVKEAESAAEAAVAAKSS